MAWWLVENLSPDHSVSPAPWSGPCTTRVGRRQCPTSLLSKPSPFHATYMVTIQSASNGKLGLPATFGVYIGSHGSLALPHPPTWNPLGSASRVPAHVLQEVVSKPLLAKSLPSSWGQLFSSAIPCRSRALSDPPDPSIKPAVYEFSCGWANLEMACLVWNWSACLCMWQMMAKWDIDILCNILMTSDVFLM